MNTSERNNRLPIDEIVVKSVKQLVIDPKKTPRKILTRTKTEEKIEERYFLLKGKPKLLAQKSQIQNEIIQSKALEPLINEKKMINRIKSELNEEQAETKNSKKRLSKNFYLEGEIYNKDAFTISKTNGNSLANANNLPTPTNLLKKSNFKKEEEDNSKEIRNSEDKSKNHIYFQNNPTHNDNNQIGNKSKFGKEKKYFDNFIPEYKPFQIILERGPDNYNEDVSNLPTSTSKAKIKNSHLITNSGCQSKIKSYFKESKPRVNNHKSKNKIAPKRKQDDLTLSEEEQLKLSHKKKKNFR
jgi:hypothetical protein